MKLPTWLRRELGQWGILMGVAGGLYLTGWHTEVLGGLQRLVLATGLVRPNLDPPAPGLALASYELPLRSLATGERVDFGQFRGKVVFLNFWATWCPPCVAEMPGIQALYDRGLSRQLAFVLVATGDEAEKVKRFIARKGYTVPVYLLDGPLPPAYASRVVPTTFVLSPTGQVMARHEGLADYDTEAFRNFLLGLTQ
ncbi:MAG: TlpA family protein disulfide reductase [Bernardetiaceae bacterium]|jgi:thiol-disulfide isomerase/thioredoxin|nr:TlpA family protein disulfide reductase [Bernardetiaceae bacterium]